MRQGATSVDYPSTRALHQLHARRLSCLSNFVRDKVCNDVNDDPRARGCSQPHQWIEIETSQLIKKFIKNTSTN